MPSTYSSSNRLNLQATGENTDVWGDLVNADIVRLEEAKDGVLSFTLDGTRTLISSNGPTDEAHFAVLNITGGGGGKVVCPNVKKVYVVRASATMTGDTVMSAGGITCTVSPGEQCIVVFTGSDCFRATAYRNASDPVKPQDLATKNYVDQQAFAAQSGNLPGQTGNAGKFLQTNGSTASWGTVDTTTAQNLALVFSLIF